MNQYHALAASTILGALGYIAAAGNPHVKGDESMRATIHKKDFGKTADGAAVEMYELQNSSGAEAKVITYGAILTELHVPDRQGQLADVVMGFDDLAGYLKGHPYFGATVGRVANRIAKGRFTLDGKAYKLAVNNGPNTLHGGLKGFDKKLWKAEHHVAPGAVAVKLS